MSFDCYNYLLLGLKTNKSSKRTPNDHACCRVNYFVVFPSKDSCRILKFIQHEQNTALEHHVIHTSPVDDDDQCQLQCYLQEKCLSYNLGTQGPGSQLVCELSDSDHYQHPGHLVFKEGFWYQPALVNVLNVNLHHL